MMMNEIKEETILKQIVCD